jgi:hypothetical protein
MTSDKNTGFAEMKGVGIIAPPVTGFLEDNSQSG